MTQSATVPASPGPLALWTGHLYQGSRTGFILGARTLGIAGMGVGVLWHLNTSFKFSLPENSLLDIWTFAFNLFCSCFYFGGWGVLVGGLLGMLSGAIIGGIMFPNFQSRGTRRARKKERGSRQRLD